METNVFFSAVQSALDAHIKRMVEEATAGLVEHIAGLSQRIDALETKLTEAKLFEQTTNVTIPIDEAKMVEALNSQEWFWEKLRRTTDAQIEQAMDDHCSTYDHDEYDNVVSNWNDEDPTEFVRESDIDDKIEGQVNEVLRNATVSISI
jgi:hypothetical protein